jgi:hypothetical protein
MNPYFGGFEFLKMRFLHSLKEDGTRGVASKVKKERSNELLAYTVF